MEPLNTQPLWLNDSPRDLSNKCIDSTDVAIIGGGITALSAGISLLKAGFSVQIFEAKEVLYGASSRAFGNLDVGVSATLNGLTKQYGQVVGSQLWYESINATINLQSHISEQKLDCDFDKSGHLKIAFNVNQESALIAEHAELSKAFPQQGIELLRGAALQQLWPGRSSTLGLFNPLSATINPYKFANTLLDEFLQLGGCYTSQCEVTKVKQTNGRFILSHRFEKTCAKYVISATNGYTGYLTPWLRHRVLTIGSYIMATKPLKEEEFFAFNNPHQVVTTAYNFKQYMRIDKQRRLIFGGRLGLSSGLKEEKVKRELNQLASQLLPFIDIQSTHTWGGQLAVTRNMLPSIGEIEPGHFYSTGYCGRGLPLAWWNGLKLAEVVERGSTRSISSFATVPFKSFRMLNLIPFRNEILSSYFYLKDRTHF